MEKSTNQLRGIELIGTQDIVSGNNKQIGEGKVFLVGAKQHVVPGLINKKNPIGINS